MATRLRKSRKKRGTRTVGWGRVGQHRKTGGKGGRGRAGLKRHKKSWMLKYEPEHFGVHGFYRHPRPSRAERWINVGDLDELYSRSPESFARGEGGLPVIDLASMGYEKLLGGGEVRGSYRVLVPRFTKRAADKVAASGGAVAAPGASGA